MERLHGEAAIGKIQRSTKTTEKAEEIKKATEGRPVERNVEKYVCAERKRTSVPERTTEFDIL